MERNFSANHTSTRPAASCRCGRLGWISSVRVIAESPLVLVIVDLLGSLLDWRVPTPIHEGCRTVFRQRLDKSRTPSHHTKADQGYAFFLRASALDMSVVDLPLLHLMVGFEYPVRDLTLGSGSNLNSNVFQMIIAPISPFPGNPFPQLPSGRLRRWPSVGRSPPGQH